MYNTTVPVIETYVFSLQDRQTLLDEATQGVVYFSLGILFRSDSFPPEVLQTFTDEFTQLPFRVLWKYNPENMPPVPDNILLQTWMPQRDILGNQSVMDSILNVLLNLTIHLLKVGVETRVET